MPFSFDPAKDAWNRTERGFGFDFAARIFDGPTLEAIDSRHDYGETRINALGAVVWWVFHVTYTQRGKTRHINLGPPRQQKGTPPMADPKPKTLDRTDYAKIAATTEPDIRRHMTEDDTPEWTIADAGRARLVRRGRPPSASPKQTIALRLDADVLARLRASGRGWQSRVNQALREWLDRDRTLPSTSPERMQP